MGPRILIRESRRRGGSGSDSTSSPSRRQMIDHCAQQTTGVDAKRTGRSRLRTSNDGAEFDRTQPRTSLARFNLLTDGQRELEDCAAGRTCARPHATAARFDDRAADGEA